MPCPPFPPIPLSPAPRKQSLASRRLQPPTLRAQLHIEPGKRHGSQTRAIWRCYMCMTSHKQCKINGEGARRPRTAAYTPHAATHHPPTSPPTMYNMYYTYIRMRLIRGACRGSGCVGGNGALRDEMDLVSSVMQRRGSAGAPPNNIPPLPSRHCAGVRQVYHAIYADGDMSRTLTRSGVLVCLVNSRPEPVLPALTTPPIG